MPEFTRSRRDLWLPTLADARIALGGKLPSMIEKMQLNDKGFVVTNEGLRVPIYLASGLGFNKAGRRYLDESIKPALESTGCFVLDPFAACEEFLEADTFDKEQSVKSQEEKWKSFNKKIGIVNYGLLIPRAKAMFAVMEGYPTDEGVAAEAAYFASNYGPVVGVRTDFRLAENPATGTNPAVSFFMGGKQFGGGYFEGPGAYEEGYTLMRRLVSELKDTS